MIITVGSKIIGFLREVILAYYYGATNITDAYIIANTIPNVIFMIIAVAIATCYVPIYINIETYDGENNANIFNSNLINMLMLICTALMTIIVLFPTQMVKIFASGFTDETLKIASEFTRINAISIYLIILFHLFSSFLQVKGKQLIIAFSGYPLNCIFIIFIILSGISNNIFLLIIGHLIAVFAQLFIVIPSVYKSGFRYTNKLDIRDKNIKKFFLMAFPAIIGASGSQINIVVSQTIASKVSTGSISSLSYANLLVATVVTVIVPALVTVLYPIIAKMFVNENIDGFKKILCESLIVISLLLLPAMTIFIIFAKQIIEFLFGHGAFDQQAILSTSSALFFYSIGIIAYGFRDILPKFFFAMGDAKTPTVNSAITICVNIILNIVLSRLFGANGIALATSLSAVFCTFLLFVSLRRKIGAFGLRQVIVSLIKILISSVLMGIIARILFNYLTILLNESISLVISIFIGVITYLLIIYFMKISDVDKIIVMIKERLSKF